MKKSLIIFLLVTAGLNLSAQKNTVKWYSIEEAEKLARSIGDHIRL